MLEVNILDDNPYQSVVHVVMAVSRVLGHLRVVEQTVEKGVAVASARLRTSTDPDARSAPRSPEQRRRP